LIDRHPGTGSSTGLAKLILSLWNDDCAYSFRECVRSFDKDRSALTGRMIEHFLKRGEDADLILAGDHIYDHIYKSPPRLWELGMAATDTKTKLRQQWETDKVAS
jgi:hypothetical protein